MTGGAYPDTVWSSLLRGAAGDETARRDAMGRLFSRYWRPVWASVRYGWNAAPEEAEDIVQGFFLDLLERDALSGLDPDRGRFRSFLKASLKHYMLKIRRDAARLKRGGDVRVVPLEGTGDVVAAPGDPEEIFEAEWVSTVLGRAISALERDLRSTGRELRWEVFSRHDLADDPPSYSELAEQLGVSQGDVRNHLHRARQALRVLVSRQVADYALDSDDAERELRHLLG
jgi:RNA polymerase sigma factor (sigma-70 family)